MPVKLKCSSCNTETVFQDNEIKDGAAECPKCGSTIRSEGGDELSETMRIDLNE